MAKTNLSKLQENFLCLAIACVDLIKLPLIDILDNHVKPSELYTKINSSTLITGNKLGPDQKNLCYIKPPDIPYYRKFDVTLLYTLIRNLCPSLKPTGGWGVEPSAAHTQLGDDIERLRWFRNREFAHANSAEISDSEFNKHWTDLQNVVNRIQSNKKAGCKTDYRQNFMSIENRLLNWDDLEKYKLLLEATMHVYKQRGDMDGPDIWIEGTEKVVCGSTAHFIATVKEKKVSHLSVDWQTLSKNKSTQIDKSNKKFWGNTNNELIIESVCKEDEGQYRAVLTIEEDRTRKTIQSNVIFLHVVGGIPTVTTSHETCLKTHSVKMIGNVFVVDDLPVIEDIFWSKNGNKIDTHGNEEKYSKVSVDVPSMTIYNVNQYDAGHYTLTATNAAGTTVSEPIVLGVPDIILGESKEESDGSQIFTFTIKSIPAPYNVQWQVSDNNSDMFTTLDENAEEYRGTSHSFPHPVLVVRLKELLKNNIYQIEVQNIVGGRRKKIPRILNMVYKDKGAGAMFAKLFNELAQTFPEKKLNRLQDLILDTCKDIDEELTQLMGNARTARDYFRILKKKELFSPLDVTFMQFLLRESNCGVLNEKCIVYAKSQKALCFYEEPPRNGYKNVKFHVEGNLSDYAANDIKIIQETIASFVGCDKEEIHLNGFCRSNSFLVVLSMKERYVNGLFNMKQQDKEKLILLNIHYFIVDSKYIYLKHFKAEENEEGYERLMPFGDGGRSGDEKSSTVVSTGSNVICSDTSHFGSSPPFLGRAGLPSRSMTVFTKRSSESTPRSLDSERTFVDSDVNQRLQIVGMPVLKSRRGPTSSSKTYVDNKYNRRLARQKMEQSLIVVSSNSGGGSTSGTKRYVDKSEETEWLHEANIRSSASTPSSSDSEITFVDSAENHRLEIVGMPVLKSSSRKSSSSKVFANNKYNLRMSRLGIQESSMVVSPNSGSGSSSGSKHHVDKSEETEWLHGANIKCCETPDEDIDYQSVRSARESRGRYNRKTKASVKQTADGDRMAMDKETGPTSS